MFKRFRKQLSFILLFTLFVQVINPLTSLAVNTSGQFNGEDLILKQNGYIYTAIDENKISTIKTYTEDGMLLEKVIVDRNENSKAIHIDYNKTKNMKPIKTIINFEDYGIIQKDNGSKYQSLGKSGAYYLGKSTIKSHSPFTSSTYYYMNTTYDKYNRQGTYSVPSFTGTMAKAIALFIGIINVPAKLAASVIGRLAWAGIVKIAGDLVTMPFFSISANITEYTIYGVDSKDSGANGELDGTKAVINHTGSKYFNETFYDGFDIRKWGDKTITYTLIQQAYPGFYQEMEVIREI